MNDKRFYQIGDIHFQVTSDLPFEIPEGNAAEFRVPYADPDFKFEFKQSEKVADYTKASKCVADVGFAHEFLNPEGKYFRAFLWNDIYYDAVLDLDIEKKEGVLSYISPEIIAEQCGKGTSLFNYLCLERVLESYEALILHSSHIVVGDEAILFCAPSGVGKSTQADLWARYEGAKIINGDRTLLRKKEGVWHAYGCPMSGTSDIHLQSCKKLKAIVILRQGPENRISKMKAGAIFSELYPQVTVQSWDKMMAMRVMDLLMDVIEKVPVLSFSCTKTQEAVDVLKNALEMER